MLAAISEFGLPWQINGHALTSSHNLPTLHGDVCETKSERPSISKHSAELRHDMRNAVCLLQLRFGILKQTLLRDEEQVAIIEQCLGRLGTLLESWKDLENDAPCQNSAYDEVFNFQEMAAEIIETYQPVFEASRHTLIFYACPDAPQVKGPRVWYERLIDNLISNACKYTPQGGQIEIRIQSYESQIRFEIKDTGIGMHAGDLQHIFDPYYRTEEAQRVDPTGTGLGLSIVRGMVELLGGEISAQSQIGMGTTFVVTFPVP